MAGALLLAAGAMAAADPAWEAVPQQLPSRYGVFGVRAFPGPGDTLKVERVHLHSPARAAGLRAGDLLVGIGRYRLRTYDELSRVVQSHAPGSPIVLHVVRDGVPLQLSGSVTDRRHLSFLMDERGRQPPPLVPPAGRPDPAGQAAEQLIATAEAGPALASLRAALAAELSAYGADGRLAEVQTALARPQRAPELARALAAAAGLGPTDLATLAPAVRRHLDLPGRPAALPAPATAFDDLRDTPLYGCLLRLLEEVAGHVEAALAPLSGEERDRLAAGAGPLLERYGRAVEIDTGDSVETEAHLLTLRLARRVDLSHLVAAAGLLGHLAEPAAVRRLRRAARRTRGAIPPDLPPTYRGDFRFAAATAWGWVVVGDDGPNVYGADAAVVVDLGGDDVYLGRPGTPRLRRSRALFDTGRGAARRQAPVGVVIDLGGDDTYLAGGVGGAGAGIVGAGLLLDWEGDDLYRGDLLAQGAAFCGVGLLVDRRGRDRYQARLASQGTAFYGLGLLVDGDGDDTYAVDQVGQGFGGAGGLGILSDRGGDDTYVADGTVPSTYDTPDVYSGWAQGVGAGFRGYTAGGLGILVDRSGRDVYRAGDFAQGAGYFFGFGVLADGGGDDDYVGARYAQGTAAHQAVGVLLDDGGRDRYVATVAAAQGAAWDAAVAVLHDRAGDDTYRGGPLCQGAAAMNGFALLLDDGGDDTYDAVTGQGHGDSVRYWGGRGAPNLGLLIDAGGRDRYDRPGRHDGGRRRDAKVGLFLDR